MTCPDRIGRSAGRLVFSVLPIVFAAACQVDMPTRTLTPGVAVPELRPSDGLLARADLQRIVDLQVAGDGDRLAEALSDPDPTVRSRAALALASVIDVEAMPALVGARTDVDPAVRRDVAFALGQFTEAMMIDAFLADFTPNGGAARAIESLGHPQTTALVRRLIGESDALSVRGYAGQAAKVGADRLGAQLVEQAETETDPDARVRLVEAAGKLGAGRTLEAFLATDLPDTSAVALAIARMGTRGEMSRPGVSLVVDWLEHPDPEVRLHVSYFFPRLVERQTRAWKPDLTRIREILDGYALDEPAAMHMVVGIERGGLRDDHPFIQRFLAEGTDWRTRTNAAAALRGWENHPEQREALLAALDDPNEHVAMRVARSLSNSPPTPVWREGLQAWVDRNPDRWRVGGELMIGIMKTGGMEPGLEWLSRFPPSETGPWHLILQAFANYEGRGVLDVYRQAALAEDVGLSITALSIMSQWWTRDRAREPLHAYYWETMTEVWDTGNREQRALAWGILRDPVFQERNESYRTYVFEALPDPGEPRIDWEALAKLGRHPRLVLDTERGRIVLVMDAEQAPLTVQTIAVFATEGSYDDTPFHRVERNFVIQGGDFTLRNGAGDPGVPVRTEITQIPFGRGVLGMARGGTFHSEGSQFFVTHSIAPHLDGGYTAFGWVEEGIEVVDRIQAHEQVVRAWIVPDRSGHP